MPGGIPIGPPGGMPIGPPIGGPMGLIPGGPPMPMGGGIALPGCFPSLPLMNAAVVASIKDWAWSLDLCRHGQKRIEMEPT